MLCVIINSVLFNPPVSNANIEKYYELAFCEMVIQPLGFISMLILPTRKEVNEWIKERENIIQNKDIEIVVIDKNSIQSM